MSGIAGIIGLDGAPSESSQIEAMLATMVHRGPDRQRSWHSGNSALGQVLLATTPEARAEAQPWVHPDSGCVLVSDSRFDNRPELLASLGLRHARPDDIGDGELLHAAWRRWGEECALHLLGDFAFVVWDPANQSLFCARDVMAVRPFYYHHVPGRLFAFASEARALLSLRQVPRDIDYGRVADALVGELEGIDATSTFYTSLRRLAPAHVMTVTRSKSSLRRYWNVLAKTPSWLPRAEQEWPEAVREQLRMSVARRLRSNVEVGSMLSGGLDSSSVVALACAQRGEAGNTLPVFSAIDSGRPGAETAAIMTMIERFPVKPFFTDLADLEALLPEMESRRNDLAEPFDGEMPLITCQYLSAAKAGVRCVLDGMPADNLYSVGDSGQRLIRRGAFRRGFSVLHESAKAAQHPRPLYAAARSALSALLPRVLRGVRQSRSMSSGYRELVEQSLIDPAFANRQGLPARYRAWLDDIRRNDIAQVERGAYSQMGVAYLQAAVERYGRVAAREGVEPRHPFLDRELIELHAWLPMELRARGGWDKWVLRHGMASVLPPSIAWRSEHEHLGLRFNIALQKYEQNLNAMALEIPEILCPGKVSAAIHAWQQRKSVSALGALLSARLVHAWLSRDFPRTGVGSKNSLTEGDES